MKEKLILNQKEVASILGITPQFFARMLKEGKGPQPCEEISYRRKLWRLTDVEKWACGESPSVHS
ncbi:MAG: helix-turn-helix transcriptional regulator [Bullifex sp.]